MRKLSVYLRIIDAASEWTGKVVSFAIALIIGTMIWVVLARLFSTIQVIQVDWTYIAVSKLFFVYIIFGAAYILRIRAHVNVDIIHGRLSLRVRGIVDAATFIAVFLFLLALLWMAVETAATDVQRLPLSLRSFLPPYWPVSLAAPIGIFLFFLQGLAKFIRDLFIAITGREIA